MLLKKNPLFSCTPSISGHLSNWLQDLRGKVFLHYSLSSSLFLDKLSYCVRFARSIWIRMTIPILSFSHARIHSHTHTHTHTNLVSQSPCLIDVSLSLSLCVLSACLLLFWQFHRCYSCQCSCCCVDFPLLLKLIIVSFYYCFSSHSLSRTQHLGILLLYFLIGYF